MMRLGIDFGTTRTVVSASDRGGFPIVSFATPDGDHVEHYPTTCAAVEGRLVYGHEAEVEAHRGAPVLRSFKRLLGSGVGADDTVQVGDVAVSLLDLTTGFLVALHRDLRAGATLPGELAASPEVVVSVPATAHSTQRFVTLEAFRRAGFHVCAMINEPSAAGLEYAHRHARTITSRREHVVVYDLGGGTFDSALVYMAGGHHDVVYTSGIGRLGGDDFDRVLLEMALEQCDLGEPGELPPLLEAELLQECRVVKEGIHPNTRRVVLDLDAAGPSAPSSPIVLAVADYYERLRPLVDRSVTALAPVLDRAEEEAGQGGKEAGVAGVYVVGGGSGLPLVPRLLRETFGRRIHRSPYPSAATAIGCAIAASTEAGSPLTERLTRHLGVFRERDAGKVVSFDPIFAEGIVMPKPGDKPLTAQRRYRAAHNIGYFRFVECGALDEEGQPCGDITPHASVLFSFVDEHGESAALTNAPVARLTEEGPLIEERYEVDESGVIAVTIANLDAGFERRFELAG